MYQGPVLSSRGKPVKMSQFQALEEAGAEREGLARFITRPRKIASLRPIVLVLVLTFLAITSGCERDTNLDVRGGSAAEFSMSGSGKLSDLKVRGNTPQRNIEGDAADIYWEIEDEPDTEGVRVESLGTVTYGKVPKGYVQVYPEQGAPPPLVEGERYYVHAATNGANGKGRYFTIQDGKVVESEDEE